MNNWTSKEKPNIVYFDPPYNTKNEKLTYKDKIENWYDFFESRVKAVKDIMQENSIIFVSIGMDELPNAINVLRKIFGKNSQISIMPRLTHRGHKTTKTIINSHDFLLIFKKGQVEFSGKKITTKIYKHKDKHFEKRGHYQLRRLDYKDFKYSKNQDFKLKFQGVNFVPGENEQEYIARKKNPTEFDWCWLWSSKRIQYAIDNDFLEIHKNRLMKKTYEKIEVSLKDKEYKLKNIKRGTKWDSLELIENHYKNNKQDKDFQSIFTYPKSENLMDWIFTIPKFKEKIILDAFAGSATSTKVANNIKGLKKLILIQKNEKTKNNSQAASRGFKDVFEITESIARKYGENKNAK